MEYLSDNLLKAFEFGAIAHQSQSRPESIMTPYFSHPAAVALILSKGGFSEEVVIAGLLHDVIEDTNFTAEDIKDRFGDRVKDLVLGVTEDSSLPWAERKASYISHLVQSDSETKAISAADLLANRRSRLDLLKQGINVWEFFDKDPTYPERVMSNDFKRIDAIKSGLNHPMINEIEMIEKEIAKFVNKNI